MTIQVKQLSTWDYQFYENAKAEIEFLKEHKYAFT